jgi:hypothetical protein
LEFIPKIQIYLSLVYIILDNTEICFLCFENRWKPEEAARSVINKCGEFLKGRPPVFSHAADPLEADDWVRAVEK